MPRGRKPKPTALKKLEGNPGKRPLNENEPRFAQSSLRAPSYLDEEARAEWNRVAPQLSAQKMLTIVDRTQLAAYCVTYSRWRAAENKVQDGELTFETPAGYQQQVPEIGIANKYLEKMIKLAAEFGFTPAARSRMNVKPAGAEGDPHDKFFGFAGEEGQGAQGDRLLS